MNAIDLLKEDHDKVEKLFEQFKANEEGDNADLAQRITEELEVHAHIEETIFYPRLIEEGDEELKSIVEEGIEEHRQVKMFLTEMKNLSDGSEKLNAKLKVVVEDVEHHVEEEEGEMFTMVEEQFDEDVLNELGAEMEKEKQSFKKGSAASGR
jgi:hemerythrin-like domain-containing protein